MIGTTALNNQMAALLVADADTLAPAMNANKIALVTTPFTPTPATVVGDLTLASGNGLDPIAGATGSQLAGTDPLTGDVVMTVKPPAGGYIWTSSGSITVPITVYGYALLSNDLSNYIAGALLAEPQIINIDGQVIDIGNPTISYPAGVTF